MLPLLIVQPDDNNQHDFIEDILKTEGLFFYDRRLAKTLAVEDLAHARAGPLHKAGDGIRTHDVQLGKLAFYH